MGWAVGYDESLKRDVGYGVPAFCDHLGCNKEIDRGIAHICGGQPFGGEKGCGLHFCGDHLRGLYQRCERCIENKPPFKPTQDHPDWMRWKLEDESWARWRMQNPMAVATIQAALVNPSDGREGSA